MTDIHAILASMTLEEKVGQLFVARRPQDGETAMKAITDYHVGGFTLYACDYEGKTPAEIRSLMASYREASKLNPFIAVDCEGGRVIRASKYPAYRSEGFKSPRALFEEGSYDRIDADTREKAAFLHDLGANFNYAPVLDLSGNPDCFIFDRTFSNDPDATAIYAETVVKAMNECKMVGSIKHFPGYGDNVDTHTSIAHDDRTMEQFMTCDLKPFTAGIKAGAPIVMIAHNIVSCMDPDCPASLSPAVHKLLREDLGFEGVIMTDSLDMNAITLYTGDRASAVQAVISGNDLLCCTTYWAQIPAVLDAVREGLISEERIDESVLRVLKLKAEYGII